MLRQAGVLVQGGERMPLPDESPLSKRNPPPRPKSKRGNCFRRAGDRTRTGDVQLGKLAFYH